MDADNPARRIEDLIRLFSSLTSTPAERELLARALNVLEDKYALEQKIAREPGVEEIIKQMVGRIYRAYRGFSRLEGQKVLDIACGSNTSKAPPLVFVNTPYGSSEVTAAETEGYTAQFEPWFCRILLELGARPVGIDLGDLSGESFVYYHADLGKPGALDFLPDHSFDAVQDSRLFGSPEFTAQFPNPADRLQIAKEIWNQERRLLKPSGIVIHSDAAVLLR